jgi:hypothetical protein
VSAVEIIGLIILVPLGIVSAFVVGSVLVLALVDILDHRGRE